MLSCGAGLCQSQNLIPNHYSLLIYIAALAQIAWIRLKPQPLPPPLQPSIPLRTSCKIFIWSQHGSSQVGTSAPPVTCNSAADVSKNAYSKSTWSRSSCNARPLEPSIPLRTSDKILIRSPHGISKGVELPAPGMNDGAKVSQILDLVSLMCA